MLTPVDFILCLVGWFILSLFILQRDKNELDDKGEVFSMSEYSKKMWDDWLFTFAASIGLLIVIPGLFVPVVAKYISIFAGMEWMSELSLFVGMFGGLIFKFLYNKIKSKTK